MGEGQLLAWLQQRFDQSQVAMGGFARDLPRRANVAAGLVEESIM